MRMGENTMGRAKPEGYHYLSKFARFGWAIYALRRTKRRFVWNFWHPFTLICLPLILLVYAFVLGAMAISDEWYDLGLPIRGEDD